jgi:hypothetical protein
MGLDDLGATLSQGRLEDPDPRVGHPVVAAEQTDTQWTIARSLFGRTHNGAILSRERPAEELQVANLDPSGGRQAASGPSPRPELHG